MVSKPSKWLALLGILAIGAAPTLFAQDSGALIDALVRKGILTNQEAEDIRADLIRDSNTIPSAVFAGGKSTDRLSVGMRLQAQYAGLETNIHNGADPVSTEHFFLRRAYLTLKAGLGAEWSAVFTYDFAGSSYDDAIVEWKHGDNTFDIGLRKVNVCYEERYTSGNLRAIERTPVTRYFVEANNGRRLGAGSYRVGMFLDGKKGMFTYSASVTNPERADNFTLASDAGNGGNNSLAYWGNVGINGKFSGGTYIAGVGAGFMPDQGGPSNTNFGKGFDLKVYSLYSDITFGRFSLMAEYLTAQVDAGVNATRDATPKGFYITPSFMITEKIEAVAQYSWLDSDGRGVSLSDGIRSAPSGGTMNKMSEAYLGGNYYFKGNDLKFQLGLVYGKSKDTVTGAPAEAKTFGFRSQMQVQF